MTAFDQIGALLDRFELINLELKQLESETASPTNVTIQEVHRTAPKSFRNLKFPCIYPVYAGFAQETDTGGFIVRPNQFNLYFIRHPYSMDKRTDEDVSTMIESTTLWASKIVGHYHERRYLQTLTTITATDPDTAPLAPLGFVRDPLLLSNQGGADGTVVAPNGTEYFGTIIPLTVFTILTYKRI